MNQLSICNLFLQQKPICLHTGYCFLPRKYAFDISSRFEITKISGREPPSCDTMSPPGVAQSCSQLLTNATITATTVAKAREKITKGTQDTTSFLQSQLQVSRTAVTCTDSDVVLQQGLQIRDNLTILPFFATIDTTVISHKIHVIMSRGHMCYLPQNG